MAEKFDSQVALFCWNFLNKHWEAVTTMENITPNETIQAMRGYACLKQGKLDELNKQLTQVKDSLDNLQSIGSSTEKNVDKAALQWEKVAEVKTAQKEANNTTNETKM